MTLRDFTIHNVEKCTTYIHVYEDTDVAVKDNGEVEVIGKHLAMIADRQIDGIKDEVLDREVGFFTVTSLPFADNLEYTVILTTEGGAEL